MSSPLVVLAAGLARRYGGCKPLAPIGPNGEAVIDLLASDSVAAGYNHLVLVLHPATGPAIRYHIEHCWPASVRVSFAEQKIPLGTVHAVLAAKDELDPSEPFAVANADDVYSEGAMALLLRHLQNGLAEHALIAYQLRATVATGDPVTRGICVVDESGYLKLLAERRRIVRRHYGESFESDDGLRPETLDGGLPTSVNLWGFQPRIWEVMQSAMDGSGLQEETLLAAAAGEELPKAEVLLPEMVADMVTKGSELPVRVINTDAKLLGVTHASDLPLVSAALDRDIALGVRPSLLWGHDD